MFNLFAKNLTTEYNNKIHEKRKREGTTDNSKRDQTKVRTKKLKSSR